MRQQCYIQRKLNHYHTPPALHCPTLITDAWAQSTTQPTLTLTMNRNDPARPSRKREIKWPSDNDEGLQEEEMTAVDRRLRLLRLRRLPYNERKPLTLFHKEYFLVKKGRQVIARKDGWSKNYFRPTDNWPTLHFITNKLFCSTSLPPASNRQIWLT